MMRLVVAVVVGASLGACATNKTMMAMGGSRADGTVRLGYEFGAFESPKVDMQAALVTARQRCSAWGYPDAEPFGSQVSQCQASNQYGCMRQLVTVEYQCTGGPGGPGAGQSEPSGPGSKGLKN